jgi:hypothetical protein
VVVLHEVVGNAKFPENLFVITLKKETAVVSKDFGFENQGTVKRGL